MSTPRPVRVLLALAAAWASGCGSGAGKVPLYPVTGEVYVAGKPAPNAKLVLVKPGNPDDVVAETVANHKGEFDFSNGIPAAGVPAGSYDVRITWPEFVTEDESTSGDRLRGRYNQKARPVLQAEVTAGKNVLPRFELK